LLGASSTPERAGPSEANASEDFAALFSPAELPRVKAWLRKSSASLRSQGPSMEVLEDTALRGGAHIRLQALFCDVDGSVGAILVPLPAVLGQGEKDNGLPEILNVIEWLEKV
jgi:hypothetical protein